MFNVSQFSTEKDFCVKVILFLSKLFSVQYTHIYCNVVIHHRTLIFQLNIQDLLQVPRLKTWNTTYHWYGREGNVICHNLLKSELDKHWWGTFQKIVDIINLSEFQIVDGVVSKIFLPCNQLVLQTLRACGYESLQSRWVTLLQVSKSPAWLQV